MSLAGYRRVATLGTGARVALIAPSGPLRNEGDLEQAESNTRLMGWVPVRGAHVLKRSGYLAGSDAERLADLRWALDDPDVDAVWCIRGGYGLNRLLDRIDFSSFAKRPRAVMGFSDTTALHAAIGRVCGVRSFHAPTARGVLDAFSRNSFERAVVFGEDPLGAAHGARVVTGGRAVGRLAGGNLALIASLAGTPFMPDLDGAILVLEDVNEAVYRVDRMLQQLRLSGALSNVAAIAFGQCTECGDSDPATDAAALDHVLRELALELKIPCISALPFGHIAEQWTLPLGAIASLDADALTLTVDIHA